MNPNILIIGAGAAGLFAGHALAQQGIDFKILEASDRHGGRLGKLEGFADYSLDLGGEWLHGKKSIIGQLITNTNTHIKRDKSKERYWFQQQLMEDLPRDPWDIYDVKLKQKPDISYLAFAEQKGLGKDYRFLIEAIAGDQGADATQLSTYWNAKEEEYWSSGNKDYKFRESYFDLIHEQIALPILDKIQLNTIVEQIDYEGDQIVVRDTNGQTYLADKVILTVPITILQAGDIRFSPPLPIEKTAAFQKIGMDPGMKVFLKFSKKFYHENIYGGSICAAYADESTGKKGKDHVLMSFVMGKQAASLSSLDSDEQITQKLLEELDEMYAGQASAYFLDAVVMDWSKHPFVRGAYSYAAVGIGNARSLAAAPIEDKLYFAGEAMNLNGHHQTVHGAAETGLDAAEWVLKGKRMS